MYQGISVRTQCFCIATDAPVTAFEMVFNEAAHVRLKMLEFNVSYSTMLHFYQAGKEEAGYDSIIVIAFCIIHISTSETMPASRLSLFTWQNALSDFNQNTVCLTSTKVLAFQIQTNVGRRGPRIVWTVTSVLFFQLSYIIPAIDLHPYLCFAPAREGITAIVTFQTWKLELFLCETCTACPWRSSLGTLGY